MAVDVEAREKLTSESFLRRRKRVGNSESRAPKPHDNHARAAQPNTSVPPEAATEKLIRFSRPTSLATDLPASAGEGWLVEDSRSGVLVLDRKNPKPVVAR